MLKQVQHDIGMKHTFLSVAIAIIIAVIMPAHAHAQELAASLPVAQTQEKAIFAGGCFWCMQSEFDSEPGISATTVGYTGGDSAVPTYENHTGHVEAIEITYDPAQISYDKLLEIFWENIDPLDAGGQFADRGESYRTAIFYNSEQQRAAAETSKQKIAARFPSKAVATEILPAKLFYPAEDEHQKFYQKNPDRFKAYEEGSGRPKRLRDLWNKD